MNASPTISNSIFITGYSIHFIQKKVLNQMKISREWDEINYCFHEVNNFNWK